MRERAINAFAAFSVGFTLVKLIGSLKPKQRRCLARLVMESARHDAA
ncbi:MAG: hypothetical protein QNJ46_20485 [Leptolyngbyaceae cyanobacterium MO_188.B28]|nr:hypothetical protein [Leptolyngbyaceae cyanobacterium MO_188.B28]